VFVENVLKLESYGKQKENERVAEPYEREILVGNPLQTLTLKLKGNTCGHIMTFSRSSMRSTSDVRFIASLNEPLQGLQKDLVDACLLP